MELQTPYETGAIGERIRRSTSRNSRTHIASAKVTNDEKAELENAASHNGKTLSEWAREVLLTAARDQVADPAFTEVVAMRMLLNSVLRRLACGETMTAEAFNTEMQSIRTAKHKAAEEVMQQYATTGRK